jgi:hypothetical protein
MKATIEEIDGELCLVFPEGECPFNPHDELEWLLEEGKLILRVVQPDLFSEQP